MEHRILSVGGGAGLKVDELPRRVVQFDCRVQGILEFERPGKRGVGFNRQAVTPGQPHEKVVCARRIVHCAEYAAVLADVSRFLTPVVRFDFELAVLDHHQRVPACGSLDGRLVGSGGGDGGRPDPGREMRGIRALYQDRSVRSQQG